MVQRNQTDEEARSENETATEDRTNVHLSNVHKKLLKRRQILIENMLKYRENI